ncbi:putative LPS assembly protein LptD [Chitinispirillales bacterium ANBcel5]|uniref:putative LPS assembly protein LptD n=1 Tax=Cellulosispirillum alkaliphilum TaxID=3039283 RepID=UPI002A590E54|nr:putative LPS assembly protein LptD [Chitinispirillales bacterium ANBcel5]
MNSILKKLLYPQLSYEEKKHKTGVKISYLIWWMILFAFMHATYADDIFSVDTADADTSPSAITDTIYYESDEIDYDFNANVLYLAGRAQVRYQNLTLQADTIIYTIDDNQFRASGKPQLIEGRDTTVGEYMVYNIETRRGRVKHATTRFDDAWFSGNQILMTEDNEIYVDEGDYTSCAHVENPDYYFYGRNIKIIPEDMIISRPVVLNIADAPVALLPYFIFPLERGRRSGWLTPVWGGQPGRGGYIDNLGYYYAPNDYVDFVFRSKIQEFNHLVLNAASQYALRYTLDGRISARYALDNDIDISSRIWALDYRHNQMLTPDGRTRLTGSGSLVSRSDFYQMFSEDSDEIEEQNLTANLSLSHSFQNINASANLVWNRRHNLSTDHIVEDLPSVDFRLPTRPLFSAESGTGRTDDEEVWYEKIYYSYNSRANVRRNAYGNDSLPGFIRPGMTQNFDLSAPQKLFNYITLNPTFSARLSSFYGAIDTTKLDSFYIYDTVSYTVDNLNEDSRYENYDTLDIQTNVFVNQWGDPETTYTFVKRSEPRTQYVRDTLDNVFKNVATWQTGITASTNIYGIFDFRLFNFTGLRHTVSPSIGYRFIPENELAYDFFDVGIPYDRARDRQQLFTLSLGNQFEGKREVLAGEEIREEKFHILSANLRTSYDFEAESRKWNNLNLNASTSYRSINARFNSEFWLYDADDRLSTPIPKEYSFTLSTGSIGLNGTLWDGDFNVLDSLYDSNSIDYKNAGPQSWRVSVTPAFSYTAKRALPGEPFIPEKQYTLNASAGINISRNWSIDWSGRYNFMTDQFVRNQFVIRADLECWEMYFSLRPESLNPGFHFRINIKKIPDIKWEHRG